ncbi:hypothetical protein F5X99DRAFT_405322 [Biscogniauxia marginata]|nr:hypothetical protein F5X99DRAFT_405322 [Biscogniauxia marginata]
MSFKNLALALRSPEEVEIQTDASLARIFAETIVEGPFPINGTSSALVQRDEEGGSNLSKRADCWSGGLINTDDIQNLGNLRQIAGSNNYMPALSWASYTLGSAKVCILNNYLYENTYVSDWEIGWELWPRPKGHSVLVNLSKFILDLLFPPYDVRVRQWFATETHNIGRVDQTGNMFVKQADALKSSAPITTMGSQLDIQPRGCSDGILGVVAPVEVLRTLHKNGHKTQYNLGIVNWTLSLVTFKLQQGWCNISQC